MKVRMLVVDKLKRLHDITIETVNQSVEELNDEFKKEGIKILWIAKEGEKE